MHAICGGLPILHIDDWHIVPGDIAGGGQAAGQRTGDREQAAKLKNRGEACHRVAKYNPKRTRDPVYFDLLKLGAVSLPYRLVIWLRCPGGNPRNGLPSWCRSRRS